VSNAVSAQSEFMPSQAEASSWLWQWGQLIDHDLDLTDAQLATEPLPIAVPATDPIFPPGSTIGFHRSTFDPATGAGPGNPREQVNVLTAWIDASMVYGSDAVRAAALRATDGSGRLATSAGSHMPFNVGGLPTGGGPSAALFLAGAVRANEQLGLIAAHTLLVREHNRVADALHAAQPGLSLKEPGGGRTHE
jgi:hypothetical protein